MTNGSIIEFDPVVGAQIIEHKRSEFVFPIRYADEIERTTDEFPCDYEVIIGNESFTSSLYKNDRPYYYFLIHANGRDAFLDAVEGQHSFHVRVDLDGKVVYIE